MMALSPTEIAILDAIAHAPETVGEVVHWRHKSLGCIPQAEAADAFHSLVEKNLLAPRPTSDEPLPDEPPRAWKARFDLTPRGHELLAAEGPLPPPVGWPEGRVYCGILRGLIPDIPFEVFKENRREMAGKYGEQSPDE